jgi:mono/diheme cytochrome c family protein
LGEVLVRTIAIGTVSLFSACGDDATRSWADSTDGALVARGEKLYIEHCAVCHGARLEGQPNWRSRSANGRLPAPPHDESGHTWHHADDVLFRITKHGLVPPYAPDGYESDMPAFAGRLADRDIWAVLAYIKSHWKSDAVLSARRQMLKQTR